MPLPSAYKAAYSDFEIPEEMSAEVQNRGISGSTKMALYVLQIFFLNLFRRQRTLGLIFSTAVALLFN